MKELRFNQSLELRHAGGKPTIVGYAARFNSLSHPIAVLGGSSFVEKISRGAFSKAIAQGDVRALVNHDPSKILGRSKAGTLMLREDASGLYCEISPPDTTTGHDVIASIRRGDLDGMSFGFGVIDEAWSKTTDGQPLRELRQVELFDVSVVTYPAYAETSVSMRSLLFPEGVPRDIEKRVSASQKHTSGSTDPYSWMSPELQKFYRHQDRKHKLDKVLASVDPDSTFGRKLKVDRELAEIKLELEQDAVRTAKTRLHERWARKDRYAMWPVWRDPETYGKPVNEKRSTKDPWATRRLF
jgi:HK97 family phage prohead protease